MVLDPGQSTAAIGFFAVPTPEFGDVKVLYDELYLHNADAHEVARAIKQKIAATRSSGSLSTFATVDKRHPALAARLLRFTPSRSVSLAFSAWQLAHSSRTGATTLRRASWLFATG